MTPEAYNAHAFGIPATDPRASEFVELVKKAQAALGLEVDGKFGPATKAALVKVRAPVAGAAHSVLRVVEGWLESSAGSYEETDERGFRWVAEGNLWSILHAPLGTEEAAWYAGIHPSWHGGVMAGGAPRAIVAHYSATDPGTAKNMARNRAHPRKSTDRAASWHVTIDTDGTVVQNAPLNVQCWHAGSDTAKPIPGLGFANRVAVGIELVGHGKEFPPAQVAAASEVWRAIVQAYGIERRYAMITHAELDPTRRSDPGPVWISKHAAGVLDYAFR